MLFTIAGMAPFKPYFLGQQTPPFRRATSVQKCVRTLDIENVGIDHPALHVLPDGRQLLLRRLLQGRRHRARLGADHQSTGRRRARLRPGADLGHRLRERRRGHRALADGSPACRRSASSAAAARTTTGTWAFPAPAARARRSTTTAAPSSASQGGPVVDEDRYLEIWNLVFMQDIRGEQSPKYGLPADRFAAEEEHRHRARRRAGRVPAAGRRQRLRDRPDAADHPVAEKLSGRKYGADDADDVRFRVIADHIRSAALVIADGVTPGNEGRGYVLRRLLRRIIRSARLLGVTDPVMARADRGGPRLCWASPTPNWPPTSTASCGWRWPRRTPSCAR